MTLQTQRSLEIKLRTINKCGIKIAENARAEITEENVIQKNYNQGILIVEGCSASVSNNKIWQNLKANIAYGGQGSQYTRIERNEIYGSVAEGIFWVEGHKDTIIKENTVNENKDGIVMYNSEGTVKENTIQFNQRSGIYWGGQTTTEVISNKVNNNVSIGIMIKDPSAPKLMSNEVRDNFYQLSLETKSSKKRLDNYLSSNEIKGQNELPKSSWSIF